LTVAYKTIIKFVSLVDYAVLTLLAHAMHAYTFLALLASAISTLAIPTRNVNASHSLINAAPPLVYLNALGMGVASKAAATSFYTKTLGIKKGASMPVPNMGQGGWSEDIDTFPGPHSSALVFMEWTDKRPFKDLPIKLTLAVDNPAEKQKLIAASGGQAVDMKTESNPIALYAKDPNGYLLELIPGTADTALKSIAVGVSDLQKSATWWAAVTGMQKGEEKVSKEWNSITLTPPKGSELVFMQWNETPKRNTKNMPVKLVFATSSQAAFTKAIQSQTPKGTAAGAIGMFQWEPIE
jgi:catechol 2,3-dioxygenase-like lactoylglutathione lyase family enzyme